MNRSLVKIITKACFDVECNEVGITKNKIKLRDLIGDILYVAVKTKQIQLLDGVHDLIQQKVRGAIRNQNDIGDAISYITTEVLKSFKFRYKYKNGDDWNNIIKSVINRRLIDFSGKQYRRNRLVHNAGSFDSDSDYLDYYCNQECDNSAERLYCHDQATFVINIIKENNKRFLPVEKEYIDTLLYLYNEGYDPMDEWLVFKFMGYEKGNSEHKREFNRIRNKAQNKVKDIIKSVSYENCTAR